jgi:two-component system response regulator protein BraR/BceR
MYRIYIVEDDKGIAQAIKAQAEMWDLNCLCAGNFRNILSEFAEFNPHLVLMDISLPFYNGYHWCKEIRKVSKVPIIFISSASDNMNIVMAMNMGADDFIAKPFDANVLMAKIQALLRRTYDFSEAVPVLEHRGALLNTGDNTLTYNDEKIELSKNEYRILLQRNGKALRTR